MRLRTNARRLAPAVAALAALPLTGCEAISRATSPEVTAQRYIFNFENTLDGWDVDGLNVGGGDWSIAPSQAVSARGGQSVALHLDNHEGGGEIWMVRDFALRPDRAYDVDVDFEFASADWGPGAHWELAVGTPTVFHTSSTWNGARVDDGFRWRSLRLPTAIRTGADGLARLAVGIRAGDLRSATYFLDELDLTFTLR